MDDDQLASALRAFDRAIELADGQSGLARIIGCTPGNVSQLVKKASPLPGRFVLKAEAGTGVSRHDLRPDIYPRDLPPSAEVVGNRVIDVASNSVAEIHSGARA